MKRFEDHQRVRVTTDGAEALKGKTGVVVRCRRADDGAWVRMDEDLPEPLRRFPKEDPHGRGRDILLYPDECESAVPVQGGHRG